jgi:hypothetical protein
LGATFAAAFTGAFVVTFTCVLAAALAAGFAGCLVFVFAAVLDAITVLVAASRARRIAKKGQRVQAPPGTNQESAVSARLH